MEIEKLDFFDQLKELYMKNSKIEPKISNIHIQRHLKIENFNQNEEEINCMDLIDLNKEESLIAVCSDNIIKIYSFKDKVSLLFQFTIKFELKPQPKYELIKSEHIRKFLQAAKEQSQSPIVKEVLLHCHFGYINKRLLFFAGGEIGYIYQLELNGNPEYDLLEGHHHMINGITSNDQGLFTCSKDGSIIQWEVDTRKIVSIMRDFKTPEAECLCVSSNFSYVLGAYSDGKLRLWEINEYRNYSFTYKQLEQPNLVFQAPIQDQYPTITQIFILKQTIVAKHLNGMVSFFAFNQSGKVQEITDFEMVQENYWEYISVEFPYLAMTLNNQLQVYSLKNNKVIYECDLLNLPQLRISITKISKRIVVIGRTNQFVALKL